MEPQRHFEQPGLDLGLRGGLNVPGAFTSVSDDSDDNQLIRFGWTTRNTSGTTPSQIEARAKIEIDWNDTLKTTPLAWSALYADSTSATWFPRSGWYAAVECEKARGPFEVRSASGSIDVALGYQLTDDPDNPDTPAVLGSYTSSSGLVYPSGFTSVSSDGKQLVRFGFLAKLPSGTTKVFASAGGEVEFGRL